MGYFNLRLKNTKRDKDMNKGNIKSCGLSAWVVKQKRRAFYTLLSFTLRNGFKPFPKKLLHFYNLLIGNKTSIAVLNPYKVNSICLG